MRIGRVCIVTVLALAALKAGDQIEETRLGSVLRALRGDFRTLAGEKAMLNPVDRLVVGLMLSRPESHP